VIVAALAAALAFVAAQESRAARHAVAGERALAAAELALAEAPALLAAAGAAPPAGAAWSRDLALPGGDSAAVRLTMIAPRLALAHAVGTAGAGRARARRSVSMLYALARADGALSAAPVTQRAWVQTF
jgi:hypothetical protein